MKALVTGGSGFVGRHLAAALREAGWRVATLDCRPPADLVLDLARDPLPRLSFDAVFHLAGDRIVCVEAVNAPAEFMAGRLMISRGSVVDSVRLADRAVSMKEVAAAAA